MKFGTFIHIQFKYFRFLTRSVHISSQIFKHFMKRIRTSVCTHIWKASFKLTSFGMNPLCLYLLERRRRKRVRRKHWVHPMIVSRKEEGVMAVLYPQLRKDDKKFRDYARMSGLLFDRLLGMVFPRLRKKDTYFRPSIRPVTKLLVTLRWVIKYLDESFPFN